MERYEAYKDSGVEWIGEIPEGWSTDRLKHLASNVVIPAESNSGRYLGLEQVQSWTMAIAETAGGETETSGILYDDTCIMFGKLRPYLAKVATPDSSGSCSSEFLVLHPRFVNRRFLAYLIVSKLFIREVNALTYGVRMPRAGWDLIGNIKMPLPSESEQRAIVNYLDVKTAEIDGLVADCEREVELLQEYRKAVISEAVTKGLDPNVPMKDSGVEWIGEIPEGWKSISLAGVTSMITNGYVGPTRDLFVGEGVRYLQSLHIVNGRLDFEKHPYFVPRAWSDSHSRSVLKEGDVLVVQTGAIGNCAIVDKTYEGCNCHALIILRPDTSQVHGKFLYYYLSSDIGKEKMLLTRTGATHPHLNSTKIRFTSIVIPPLDAQCRIIERLDAKTAEIDSLIETKKQMADKLREYRKSLISEAVTGKFKVPGVD